MDRETPTTKSAPDDDRMIHTAHASRCHWGQVATVTQAQRVLETADPLHWYLAGAAHETGRRREPLWVYRPRESLMGIRSWFTSGHSPEEPGWIRRLVFPRPGRDDPKVDQRKEAAEADVEEIEEEGRSYFREDAPGHSEDDL